MVMRSFGYSDKSCEEYPPSFSTPGLSRHDSPVIPFTGFSNAGSCAQGFISRRRIRILKAAAEKALALSSRRHVLSLGGGSGFPPPYEGSTTSPPCGGLRSPGFRSRFLGRFLPPGSSVVVRRCTPRGRGSSGPSSARSRPVHRRLGRGLGCVSRFRSTFGLVVSELLPIFDQPPRTSGCLSRSPWLPTSASAPLGGSLPGQHHCVSISSEGGGHEIVDPQYSGSGDSPFLRGPLHPSPPAVYSGPSKRVGRCSQSELPGSGLRVDPLPGGLQGFVSPLASHSGSVCHIPHPPSASLLLTGGGSSGGRGGRDVAVLGSSSGVCVPPLRPPSPSTGQGASVAGSGAHARGSVLDSQALVPGSLGTLSGDSGPPSALSRSAPSTALSLLPSQSSRSSVDWVSHCERSTRSLGFSAPVAHQLARSRRSSTRSNYQSKWLTYRMWCHRNGRSVSVPTIPKIVDFLLYLRCSLGLSYSSIASYRSMLSASFRFLLPDISSHPVLHDLIRSFRIERPLPSSRVPSWDLSLVLSLLRGAPFEPLVSCSLRDLTRKLLVAECCLVGGLRSPIAHSERRFVLSKCF